MDVLPEKKNYKKKSQINMFSLLGHLVMNSMVKKHRTTIHVHRAKKHCCQSHVQSKFHCNEIKQIKAALLFHPLVCLFA